MRGGFRSHKLGLGRAQRWIYDHCRIRSTIGVDRLDFRLNELQVYWCPAGASSPLVSSTGARSR